jgi:hypothetical protein
MKRVEGDGHRCCFSGMSRMASARALAAVDPGRVEFLAELDVVGVHLGNGEGRLDSLVCGAVVVLVCQGLGMVAGVIVAVGGGCRGRRWLEWDGKGVDVEVMCPAIAEQSKALGDCLVEACRFGGLWWEEDDGVRRSMSF